MKFGIIYADPPWSYDDKRTHASTGMALSAYATMELDEIVKLPVSEIAASDSALFLWATYPKLAEAMTVMRSWGFTYKTVAFTWIKLNPSGEGVYSGLGHWTNANAEIVLFGTRGHPKRVERNVKQVIVYPRGRHSAKPPLIRERIVRLMGDLPRVELFARERTPGWEAIGDALGTEFIASDIARLIRAEKQETG